MPDDSQLHYTNTRQFIESIGALMNALGDSKLDPKSIGAGVPYEILSDGQSVSFTGSRMLDTLYANGKYRSYDASYLQGARQFFGYARETILSDRVAAYRALAATNRAAAETLLTSLVRAEIAANLYRDPYRQGLPSLLPDPPDDPGTPDVDSVLDTAIQNGRNGPGKNIASD